MLEILFVFALISYIIAFLEKPLVNRVAFSKDTCEAITNRRKLIILRLGLSILLFCVYILITVCISDFSDYKAYTGLMKFVTFFLVIGVQQYGFKGILGNISCLTKTAFLSSCDRFVLFLRGFDDDDYSAMPDLKKDNFENFSEYGFMSLLGSEGVTACAIGMTKEADSPIGAKRIYVDDSSWKDDVNELMEKSEIIYILVRDKVNCIWEIEKSLTYLNKVNFIVDDVQAYKNVRNTLKSRIDLPEINGLLVGAVAVIAYAEGEFNVALYSNSIDGYASIMSIAPKKLAKFKRKARKKNAAINFNAPKTLLFTFIGMLIAMLIAMLSTVALEYDELKERARAILSGDVPATIQEKQELRTELKREFEKYNAELPIEIDENTILKRIDFDDEQLLFEYEVVGVDIDDVDMKLLKLQLTTSMEQKQLGIWCALGIEVVYKYCDEDEEYEIVFSKNELNAIRDNL